MVARELTAELTWVAGELGGARDAEVMAERFAAILAELPDELKLGPVDAAHLDGGNGFTHGLMYTAEAACAERAENNLPPTWQRMRKRKNAARLGR